MKPSALATSLALAASLALTVPAAPAFAQSTSVPTKAQQQEAATRFKKGVDLFKDGDYQAALIEFRRAYELAPNFNVLYNIGQVYFQLQDYPHALASLQQYLSDGGKNIPASRRAEVERDIDKLKARVANVEITSAVADADVAIDDVAVGKTPLGKPIMVSAGRHKITISKTGFTPSTKVVEIASAESLKVALDPVEQPKGGPPVVEPPKPPAEQPATPPPAAQPETPPPAPPPQRSVPWAGIVVTGALTAGAVTCGILALNASSSLKDERASPTATRDSLDGARDKTTAFALATDILTGGAVIALGVTLYVGLRTPEPEKKPAGEPPKASLFNPTVRLGAMPGGAQVFGTF